MTDRGNFAQILDEYLKGLEAGNAPEREALLAAHPDLAEDLQAALLGVDFVHRAAPHLNPEQSADTQPGRSLGDYRLLRELGRGGMAVVYEAEQISLGRRVALKVLPFAAVLDQKHLQRFKNEAMAAAHLHHANIVPVYGVGCERGVHYYAMQYVEGQNLATAIRDMKAGRTEEDTGEGTGEGPKTPISSHGSNREPAYIRMAATLGLQAAVALDHAHQLGIVHRDVKPGNLLVDLAGTLWITDFGLACSVKDVALTITGELLGTIRYMSPEQALAKRVPVDHRTDVYSLGATLYELFTLQPAFPGEDPHLVLQDIACKEAVLPRRLNPALPRDLETVLLKAMCKDPGGRYATAQEMADDLGRYLENRAIEAKRPGPFKRVAKWGRRHRALVATVAGVLLLAVAIGTSLLWREQEHTNTAFKRAEANLVLALKALDQIYVDEAKVHPEIREGLPHDLLERGLGFYEEFARQNAHSLHMAQLLGNAHYRAGLIFRKLGREDRAEEALDRAISAYREHVRFEPDHAFAHFDLGNALSTKGDIDRAIISFSEAIRLEPNFVAAHCNLSEALLTKGDLDGAIASASRTIQLESVRADVLATAHSILGAARGAKGDTDGAIAAASEAIRLKPDYAEAYCDLGIARRAKGDIDGAIASYSKAIQLKPELFEAHYNLGLALRAKGDIDGAIASFRKAVALKPTLAAAHSSLANALYRTGDIQGAAASYRDVIRLSRDDADAHYSLGCALLRGGDPKGAIEEYHEAIRIRHDYAEAYCNLGAALEKQARFSEALPWLRKGHELGSVRPDWNYPSGTRVESAERKAEMEGRLDQVVSGEDPPSDAVERIAFADLLYAKSRYAESARMYAEAFAEDEALAEDLANGHRYNAACSAAQASARGGADAAEWRGRALEWLRADLAGREKAPSELAATLEHWKQDPDLAAVRDRLDELPKPECEAWRSLWAAVDRALAAARQTAK